jgi:probable HAF family extracellular repeat protein
MGINNFGSIVGYYRDAMGHTHGFLYIAETFNSIDFPDASETYALGINDSGDIVGWYTPDNIYGAHGFLYTGGSFNTIDVPESSQTFAYGINNFGNIVGYFNDANGTYGFVAFSSPPSPPTDVQASDGTYMDKVQISWTPSLGTTSYTVYRATSSNTWARKTVLGTTSETFFNDNTAVPMSTYFYYVRASNVYGSSDFSSYDAGYCSDGTPPVPTNVQACDGTYLDKVEVTWDASAMATSYTVYRAASLSRRASKTNLGTASETHFNDTTAIPMKTYYYYVKASNTYGMSGYSAYDSGYRSDGRPPIPTNVAASDGAYIDKVEVTWTGSPEATSYTVYRATSTSRRATKVAIGTTTDTAYNDTTTLTGKTYYYWVKASNSYGESGYSAYDTGYR